MLKLISRFVPERLKKPLKRVYNRVRYFGLARYCPVCGSHVRFFKPYGLANRTDACCVICNSLERQRLVWSFLKQKTDLLNTAGKKMLYVAPIKALEEKFQRIRGLELLTADLNDPNAMVKMDITNIQYSDNSFDVIFCSHVLEHVPDDRKAISEFRRVLKDDGWVMLLVPVTAEKSFEDISVTDPAERTKLFGQNDHVRVYGPDFLDRLEEGGLKVDVFYASDLFNENEMSRFGLKNLNQKKTPIYYCTKKRN